MWDAFMATSLAHAMAPPWGSPEHTPLTLMQPQGPIRPWSPRRSRRRSTAGTLEGSRRAFSADFIRTLADDFRLHGRQAIEKVRKTQPAAYMKICALLVPREMKLEHSGGIKAMTDEQLERSIELIKEILAQREVGANAKVIEGTAQGATSAPTELQQPRRNRSNRLLEHVDTAIGPSRKPQ